MSTGPARCPARLLIHPSLALCAATRVPCTGLVSSWHQHLGSQSPPQPGLGLSPPVLPTASLHCGRAARSFRPAAAASPGFQHKPSSFTPPSPGVVKWQSRESRAGLRRPGRAKGSVLGHQRDPHCSEGQVPSQCVAGALAPVPARSLLPARPPAGPRCLRGWCGHDGNPISFQVSVRPLQKHGSRRQWGSACPSSPAACPCSQRCLFL